MKFKVSDRSAVQVKDAGAAAEFYGGVLGLPVSEEDGFHAVAAGPLTLYIDPSDLAEGIVLELCVAGCPPGPIPSKLGIENQRGRDSWSLVHFHSA